MKTTLTRFGTYGFLSAMLAAQMALIPAYAGTVPAHKERTKVSKKAVRPPLVKRSGRNNLKSIQP